MAMNEHAAGRSEGGEHDELANLEALTEQVLIAHKEQTVSAGGFFSTGCQQGGKANVTRIGEVRGGSNHETAVLGRDIGCDLCFNREGVVSMMVFVGKAKAECSRCGLRISLPG